MRKYYVYVGTAEFAVLGCEDAYEAFRKACEFAAIIGQNACLVDGETCEVLADSEEEV